MNELIPHLYANCILVGGVNNYIICDLQRTSYVVIPYDLYKILKEHKGKSLKSIKHFYNNEYDDIIEEYFQLLIDNEFVFLTDTPELFPDISMQWSEPFQITNAIIDIGRESDYEINTVLNNLSDINCKFLQIRFFKDIMFKYLVEILDRLDNIKSNTISVDLIIQYNNSFNDNNILMELFDKYKRLSSLYFYSSVKSISINPAKGGTRYIVHTNKPINSIKSCGIISNDSFSINIKTFSESLKHNSCLNRKISIDAKGNIKNCPSTPQSFGNIKDTTLEEALNHKDFKKYWNITKDEITVCKDCEFRYICTDCRAYTETPEDMYSKPLKCGYNPYTNKWEEWSTNPLKQKAIKYYGMQDLIKTDEV